jgi:hypothetical protein
MGRGRAKAKQTKKARELKYYSPDTDLNALERELSSDGPETSEYDVDYRDFNEPFENHEDTEDEPPSANGFSHRH